MFLVKYFEKIYSYSRAFSGIFFVDLVKISQSSL